MNAITSISSSEHAVASPDAVDVRRKQILIIGGGFAGVAAVRALRHAKADVVLIDRRNHHVFQPLLYQVATAVISPAEVAAPLRELEVRHPNLRVLLGEVTGVSLEQRTVDVTLAGSKSRKLAFDYLVVATGSQPSYFGHDEFAAHAPALKNLADAEAVRGKILRAFEVAEVTDDDKERERQMTFVLVGAGPTGVELAASLAQMVKTTLRGNFRRIDPANAKIILIDGANRILPANGEAVSRIVEQRLAKLGVTVVTGRPVDSVDADGVVVDGKKIQSATVLWTAGVAASPLVKALGVETDRAGRALVDPQLRVAAAPGVFVAGDSALVKRGEGRVPGVAQAAIQEGRFVGKTIAAELNGQNPQHPFRYFDKGNMAVVGDNFAVLERGSLHTKGFLTWLLWAFVHILSLPQMQNRLRVQRQWLWSYLTGQRSSRIIPEAARSSRSS